MSSGQPFGRAAELTGKQTVASAFLFGRLLVPVFEMHPLARVKQLLERFGVVRHG